MGDIAIAVNGDSCRVPSGSTVADLVQARGLTPTQVAVEVNQDLVPRDARAETPLREGDRVELVTLVGGG